MCGVCGEISFEGPASRVRLEVRVGLSSDLLGDLRCGRLDLVVANRQGEERGGRIIWTEPLRWIAARDYILPASGPLPLVALPPQCLYRQMALDALRRSGRDGEVIYSCTSLAGVEAALVAGSGIAVLGQSSLRRNNALCDIGHDLPELPDCEIAVFGENVAGQTPVSSLVSFIEDSLVGDARFPGRTQRA